METKPERRQPSSVDLLPDSVQKQLREMLDNPRILQKEAVRRINAILAEMRDAGDPEALDPDCPEKVTTSSVNRFDLRMRAMGERLRKSREMAKLWMDRLGTRPQGEIGALVNGILQSLSFETTVWMADGEIDEENAPAIVHMLKDLALTSMRLEKAASINLKRDQEIRREALEEAADRAGEAARAQGMDAAQVEFWKRKVLGIQ